MHNIAGNCNLQLLDGLVYLEAKEKEERQGGKWKSFCMHALMMFCTLKIKCLQ